MAYPPNSQQLKAISEFDKNLLVSAGAGTGKTSVLTSKFLRLLEERRAEVKDIVAITFTNKAAAEMRERVQRGIEDKIGTLLDSDEITYWQSQLAMLENSRICTFHSFCLGLIREHPLESGIPPITGILSDGEETLFLKEAITRVFTEIYADPNVENQEFHQLLLEFGWETSINSCLKIFRAIRERGQSFATVIAKSVAFLENSLEQSPFEAKFLVRLIDNFLNHAKNQKLTEHAIEVIENFLEIWTNNYRMIMMEDNPGEIVPILHDICKALPRNLPNSIKPQVVEIHESIAALIQKFADRYALNRLPLFQDLFQKIDDRYRNLKLEAGLVDFTDQQILARDLLIKNPELTARLRREIRYILVDEFQDTNSLQMELIHQLVGEEDQTGRWMAVGDIKQSIYRFRGAEADIIIQLRQKFEEESQEIVPLTINYRSNPLIINYVNLVSQQLFASENFQYESLEATRNDLGSGIDFILSGEGTLEKQAQQVGAYIASLIAESQDTDCPISYKDIVILFRASTSMPLFQQALQELNIPFYATGGSEFFQRQEVIDQLNFLRLVEQHFDVVALLGLLRSPYVGLSEASLFWLSHDIPEEGLLEQFYREDARYLNIDPAERERLLRFRKVLLELQENRDQYQIPDIIRTAVLKLNYREMLWTMNDSRRRLANLDKLIAKAEEYSTKGYSDLTSFLTYIEALEGVDTGETDAPTQAETQNVVRLMTIHRSKGLEFPVVIIPDLDRRFRNVSDTKLTFHKDFGLGFKAVIAGDNESTSLWEVIKETTKREEISELKRVLYVALTRAGRRLVLAGSGESGAKTENIDEATSWMRWFELIHPFPEKASVIDFHGVPIRLIRELPENIEMNAETLLLDELVKDKQEVIFKNQTQPEVAAAADTLAYVSIRPITFKVTEILTFKDCPRLFYLKYRLRLPDLDASSKDNLHSSGSSDGLGAEIGNFLHAAARLNIKEWPEELWIRNFGHQQNEHLKKELQLMWLNLTGSPYLQEHQACWDETPFIFKLNSRIRVEGRFDRLFIDKSGKLRLVDYKTHRVGLRRAETVASGYFWQLQLYALAVKSLWGKLPDLAELYFPFPDISVLVPLDEESLLQTVTEIEKMAAVIDEYDKLESYPVKEDCTGCGHRFFCKKEEFEDR